MRIRFMIWWLVTVTQLVLIGTAVNYGAIDFLLTADITRLSFVIIAMWFIATGMIGYVSFYKKGNYDLTWFMAETAMSVGMVGTLIGFMLMLSGSLADIDPGNIDGMKTVIADMANGMSTALVTTLCGLVTSIAIKIQIVSQEYGK